MKKTRRKLLSVLPEKCASIRQLEIFSMDETERHGYKKTQQDLRSDTYINLSATYFDTPAQVSRSRNTAVSYAPSVFLMLPFLQPISLPVQALSTLYESSSSPGISVKSAVMVLVVLSELNIATITPLVDCPAQNSAGFVEL